MHTTNQAASHRALKVPELARTVCALLEKKDYVKLLYLCREVYTAVRPIVWETADLSSFRSLSTTTEITNEASEPTNKSSPETNLTREIIHSAFVTTLCVRGDDTDVITNRSGFELPNLQRLILTLGHDLRRIDCESWLFNLLASSPGLLELRMISMDSGDEDELGDRPESCPEVHRDVLPDLLDCLSRNCPRLEQLRLFPSDKDGINLSESVYDNIARLTHLRSFSIVTSGIHAGLIHALGQLPHLESLLLRASGIIVYDARSITVSNDSFLCLKRLALYGFGDYTMTRICGVSEIFRRLITTDISFDDSVEDERYGIYQRSVIAVKSMGANSPNLSDLTIWTQSSHCWLTACLTVVDAFKSMPLTRLRLCAISFDIVGPDCDREYDSDDSESPKSEEDEIALSDSPQAQWTTFLSALPHLQELHLSQQTLDILELQLLASLLPEIQLLVLGGVRLDEAQELLDEVNATQEIIIRCSSCFKGRVSALSTISSAARYMHGLWPNVIFKAHTHRAPYDEQTFVLLNKALRDIRLIIE